MKGVTNSKDRLKICHLKIFGKTTNPSKKSEELVGVDRYPFLLRFRQKKSENQQDRNAAKSQAQEFSLSP